MQDARGLFLIGIVFVFCFDRRYGCFYVCCRPACSSGLLLIVCFFSFSVCLLAAFRLTLISVVSVYLSVPSVLHSGGKYQPGHYAPVDNSRRKLLSVASLLYATLTFVGRHVLG